MTSDFPFRFLNAILDCAMWLAAWLMCLLFMLVALLVIVKAILWCIQTIREVVHYFLGKPITKAKEGNGHE